ncbi:MAG TPA: phage holin family protein [Anaeromyxobacteraceae bacterium]|nr:phage holin family protein [Anaeromyxobacteraceae bacterium]
MSQAQAAPVPAPAPAEAPRAEAPVVSLRTGPRHRWRFHRVGGLDQVSLETADDLRQLPDLDQKLWVALSCPVKGLELDARTLELLDVDRDGRVRVPEIVEAIRFCDVRLRDLALVLREGDTVALADVNDGTPEGAAWLAAARRVLGHRGKPDAERVTVEDVADLSKVFDGTVFNGDGIVTPDATDDADLRQVLVDAIACVGGEKDRGGTEGLTAARVEKFYGDLAAYAAWWRAGESRPDVMLLGERTAAAVEALRAVRAKVNDWFVRCGLAAIDPRGAAVLNRTEAEYAALAAKDLAGATAEVAGFPLARAAPGRALPLDEVNPAWAGAVDALRREVLAPILGDDVQELTAAAWARVQGALAPADAWYAEMAGGSVAKLGRARVEAILAGPGRAGLEELLARDKAAEPMAKAIGDVARLVHYRRDLFRLLRNFVSFTDFYDPNMPAIFQAGTLYVDGRSCELCVRVEDAGAHATAAAPSRMYVAYCALKRPGASMNVAACVTQGDSDYLTAGRNGIFYDRQGRDWDATVVKVLENPISIRQAFFAPYKKFVRLVEDNVARFAAVKAKASDETVAGAATTVTETATGQKAPPPAPPPADIGKTVGIVAALGVGIGALGTLFGGFVSGFMNLQPWWAKIVAVGGVVLLISGPSMLIAWLKLRQRTLGPILDGTGWAVNGRVKVNIPLGASLTGRALLPAGAHRSLADPFEDVAGRRNRRISWLVILLFVAALAAARWYHVWPFRLKV